MYYVRFRLAAVVLSLALFSVGSERAQAAANAVLASVQLFAVQGGGTRLALTFSGPVPTGYALAGADSRNVTVRLPNTVPGQQIVSPFLKGANVVDSATLNAVGSELDVELHLRDIVTVRQEIVGNALVVDITPEHAPTAAPNSAIPAQAAAANVNVVSELVVLKYADVSEVVGILEQSQEATIPPNDTFQETGSIFTLPTSTTGSGAGLLGQSNGSAALEPPLSVGQRINEHLAIDRRLNAVMLTGTHAEVAVLKAEIAQIDVPLPGVLLDCNVVELSDTAAHDLGLDLAPGPGQPIAQGGGTLNTGAPITNGTPVTTYTASFTASLYATIQHGGGHILASPRVLALDGTRASILTGDALPISSTTVFPGSPPVTQTTITYIAVGVNLEILPRITLDGLVTSHILTEVSSVAAYVQTPNGQVPQISLRQSRTQATVRDGEPFVVGGLLEDEEISTLTKIPLIGDLPLIGGFFRSRHDSTTRSNLFIVITPHIIQRIGSSNPGTLPTLPTPSVPGPTPHP